MIKTVIVRIPTSNQINHKNYNNSKRLKLVREGAEIICSGKMFQQYANRKIILTTSSVTSRGLNKLQLLFIKEI